MKTQEIAHSVSWLNFQYIQIQSRNLNGGTRSLFDPYVNAMAAILTVTYGGELIVPRLW